MSTGKTGGSFGPLRDGLLRKEHVVKDDGPYSTAFAYCLFKLRVEKGLVSAI